MHPAADDRALLQALLEYALAQLAADHVTFCAWDAEGSSLTVVRSAGSLTHAEVLPSGMAIPIGELDQEVYAPTNREPRVYRVDDPTTIPGVRAFLARVGARTEITFPVVDRPGGRWVMEAFYRGPTTIGARELRAGTRLAPLAAAAVDREALTDRLAEAETRFRTLVEQLPAITYVDAIDGTPLYTSPQVESLLGFTVEEWQSVARPWIARVHPDDRERVRAKYVDAVAAGQLVDLEYRVLAADGRELWFYDQARALPDDRVQPAVVQGVMLDITDRKHIEQALRDSEARRQRVLEEMLRGEEAERARIATELHDDTIQVMTASLLLLDRLRRAPRNGSPDASADTLEEARQTLAQAVERTRRMTFQLRPPLLEAQGLRAAVRDLAEEAAHAGHFRVELDLRVGRHAFVIEDLAYRTVAEALSNARRHSGAALVRVRLDELAGRLHGEIVDDGRGFDVDHALDRSRMRMHLGLDAMRERVALAGGALDVRSRPGQGTVVSFAVPLSAA